MVTGMNETAEGTSLLTAANDRLLDARGVAGAGFFEFAICGLLSDTGDVQSRPRLYLWEFLECWLREPVSLEEADAGCLQN